MTTDSTKRDAIDRALEREGLDWGIRFPASATGDVSFVFASTKKPKRSIATLVFHDVNVRAFSEWANHTKAERESLAAHAQNTRPAVLNDWKTGNLTAAIGNRSSGDIRLEGSLPFLVFAPLTNAVYGHPIRLTEEYAREIGYNVLQADISNISIYLDRILACVKDWRVAFYKAMMEAVEDAALAHVPESHRSTLIYTLTNHFEKMLADALPQAAQREPLKQPLYADRKETNLNALEFLEAHYGELENRPTTAELRQYDLPLYNALSVIVSRNRTRGVKPDKLEDFLTAPDKSVSHEQAMAALLKSRQRSREQARRRRRKKSHPSNG